MAEATARVFKIFIAFELLVCVVLFGSGAVWVALQLNTVLGFELFDPLVVQPLSRMTGWLAVLTCALLPLMEMFRRHVMPR